LVQVVVESYPLVVVEVSSQLEEVEVSYRLVVVVEVSYRLLVEEVGSCPCRQLVVEVALLSQLRLWLLALVVFGSLGPLCLQIGLALEHPSWHPLGQSCFQQVSYHRPSYLQRV
jgi:hypothetical protein